MPREMKCNEALQVGDIVFVKTKPEIESLMDDRGEILWASNDGLNKNTLYFGHNMYKYCGVRMVVSKILGGVGPREFASYRLRLPDDTDVQYIDDEYGVRFGKDIINADLRTWAWVPSMLAWPDEESEEEIAGVDADSLFSGLFSS